MKIEAAEPFAVGPSVVPDTYFQSVSGCKPAAVSRNAQAVVCMCEAFTFSVHGDGIGLQLHQLKCQYGERMCRNRFKGGFAMQCLRFVTSQIQFQSIVSNMQAVNGFLRLEAADGKQKQYG